MYNLLSECVAFWRHLYFIAFSFYSLSKMEFKTEFADTRVIVNGTRFVKQGNAATLCCHACY